MKGILAGSFKNLMIVLYGLYTLTVNSSILLRPCKVSIVTTRSDRECGKFVSVY